MSKFTIRQFNERYPTSDACLEEIKRLKFANFTCPKCERQNMLYKIKGRPQYACPCGRQVSPLAGTIFHKSATDLRTWFYALYIMTQTRAGISAKQLERETGVTYKCAHRIFKMIRTLMADNDGDLLKGVIEIDETYIGGYRKGRGKVGMGAAQAKAGVMGMVERGGRVRTELIDSTKFNELIPRIRNNVAPHSTIMTDQLRAYQSLKWQGFWHWWVNHSEHEYGRGPIHTNTIEGFWGNMKRGITGVYRHVDIKYLQSYTNEYAWLYSNRKSEIPMFDLLLRRVAG